jgi:hypothetical protein
MPVEWSGWRPDALPPPLLLLRQHAWSGGHDARLPEVMK